MESSNDVYYDRALSLRLKTKLESRPGGMYACTPDIQALVKYECSRMVDCSTDVLICDDGELFCVDSSSSRYTTGETISATWWSDP